MKGVRVQCVTSLYSSIFLSPSSTYQAGNVSRLNLLFDTTDLNKGFVVSNWFVISNHPTMELIMFDQVNALLPQFSHLNVVRLRWIFLRLL